MDTPDQVARYFEKKIPRDLANPNDGLTGCFREEPVPVEPQQGIKYDEGKVPMELIPPEMLFAVATILGGGRVKYGPRNWEKGMAWGRVFGALMRHLWCWWGGKGPTTKSFLFGDLDSETGYSHLWHALCCIAFLVTYEERGVGTDDRLGAGQ